MLVRNKKGVLFSTVSILIVILFVSFVLGFTAYQTNSNNLYLTLYANSQLSEINDSVYSSVEDFLGHEYDGVYSTSDGYYHKFSLVSMPNSLDTTFSDHIKSDYLEDNYGLVYSDDFTYYSVYGLQVNQTAARDISIQPIDGSTIDEINMTVYLNYPVAELSTSYTPSNQASGVDINIIYEGSDGVVGTYSYILDPLGSDSFIPLYTTGALTLDIEFGNNYGLDFLRDSGLDAEIRALTIKILE